MRAASVAAASFAPAAVLAAVVVSAASLLLGAGGVSWGVTPAGARALPGTVSQIAPPSRTAGATTALVVNAVDARSLPAAGHRVIRVGTATDWSQQPETLLVLGSRQGRSGQWLRVLLGVRPNGLSGWIPRADVLLSRTRRAHQLWRWTGTDRDPWPGGASLADPLGSERSHGCIRVDNDEIEWLATLAAQGTPFLIVH